MRQLSSRTKVKQGSGGKKGAFKIFVHKKGVGGRKKLVGLILMLSLPCTLPAYSWWSLES